MKSSFTGYYAPTTEQYEVLWKDALFVLDTNVLLNLYRLPTLARDELIGVLELLKDRLWIPHQVGLEFQRGRLTVIANERKSTEEALSAAQNVVGQVKSKVEGLQIDKRGLGIESKPLLDELERSNQKLIDAITAIHSSQLDVSSTDVVRQKLDLLLDQKVGNAPSTQKDLDELVSDGEERFDNKIPPGFADSEKDKNPNDAYFIYDHIKYQRKFGDLILWKQLLNHVKETKIKKVLFITADRKEDWWWREQGKTIGPHPELMREIKREGGVELFWMYSSVQFVEHANKYSKAKVSTESVAEIEQVAQLDASHIYPKNYSKAIDDRITTLYRHEHLRKNIDITHQENMLLHWLSRTVINLSPNPKGSPEFIASTPKGLHGYMLSRGLNITGDIESTQIPTRVRKALFEVLDGKLSALTVFFILDDFETEYLLRNDGMLALREKIELMLKQNPITEIYVGEFFQDTFRVLLHHRGYPSRFSKFNSDPDME
ncbi:PIN-like domain-containing protein [Pseudomonas siliginis]|uniref:PIN-like domain-containing protein n=1 Tax=Pseudomonas siliginis TaxID=2842346 RepID=UPI002092EED8|nr:PIN-like domain-containing protein [Pseudomonas siliginis]UST80106.1 PIN-like domain-containing protein [Pseudomonas siliginis]